MIARCATCGKSGVLNIQLRIAFDGELVEVIDIPESVLAQSLTFRCCAPPEALEARDEL